MLGLTFSGVLFAYHRDTTIRKATAGRSLTEFEATTLAGGYEDGFQLHALGHGTDTGNTMCFWSQVCTGMGMGMGLPYPGNTVPFSTVLRVCPGMDFGQVSDHLTLLITHTSNSRTIQPPPQATARGVEMGSEDDE